VQGGFPHPGDLLHATFLYHMALNGIEVVKEVLP
ncbi:MAG: cysteine hydrolase, partial [Anaerolineaceae bacterium]|nr:cysteine hydrolase [Anaerolineaceae bacterium]